MGIGMGAGMGVGMGVGMGICMECMHVQIDTWRHSLQPCEKLSKISVDRND